MKVYRGTDGDLEPVEKEWEGELIDGNPEPHYTKDGEIMYDNTMVNLMLI